MHGTLRLGKISRDFTALSVLFLSLVALTSCGGSAPPPIPAVSVLVSPPTATVLLSSTEQFTATVINSTNTGVTWTVSGVPSGNSIVGTISSSGLYTAPASLPTPSSVTVSAASQADPTKSASVMVSLAYPAPTLTSSTPSLVAAGAPNTVLTITGTNYFSTSIVNLNGSPLATTFVSATQLSATVSSTSVASAGTSQVTVTNPSPGGGTSASASLTVTVVASLVILATPQNGGPTDGPWQLIVAASDASGHSIASLQITLTSSDGTVNASLGETDPTGAFLATISPPGTNTGQAVAVTAATGAQTAVINIGFVPSPSATSVSAMTMPSFDSHSNSTPLSSDLTPMFGPMLYGVSGNAGSTSPFGAPSNCFSNVGLTQVPSNACQTTLNASGILSSAVTLADAACTAWGNVEGIANCAGTALSGAACLTGVGALVCAGGLYYFGVPCLEFVATQLATRYGGQLAGLLLGAGLAGLEAAGDPANPSSIVSIGCTALDAASFGLGSGSSGAEVAVNPPKAVVPLGGTLQFISNTSVNWSVVQGAMGGSITNTGLYTAPTTMPFIPEVTVDASSIANSTAVAQEGVTLVNSAGGSSGSTAVTFGVVNGQIVDEAYVPLPHSDLVSVVNLDATAGTSPVVASIATPSYSPNATAADQSTQQVVVVSYTSPNVLIVDTSQNKVLATLTSPVVDTAFFSGGSCMVCGVAINATSSTAILDTADGYLLLDLVKLQFSAFIANTVAGENFGYNPNPFKDSSGESRQIALNPTYDQIIGPALQAIDLNRNNVFFYSGSLDPTPDSAAFDFNTGIAVVPDEFTGHQLILNMAGASFSAGTFSAPNTVVYTGFTSCGDYGDPNEWTMVSIESSSHFLFLGTEFGDCAAVEPMPTTAISGAPPVPGFFNWGHMPAAPDGIAWDNGADPHGIAVFTSVVDGRAYGFLVRRDQAYVARIDIAGVAGASPMAGGGPGQVDLTPYVVFLKTQ